MAYPDNSRALNDDHLQPPEDYPTFGILDAKIDWMEKWGNEPVLQILVEKVFNINEFKYDVIEGTRTDLYFAQLDGQVSYFAHNKFDETGFAGRTYSLQPAEEDQVIPYTIKGPWSSRSSAMNNHFEHSVEVSLIDNEEGFKRGFTFYASAITIDMALEAFDVIHTNTGDAYALAFSEKHNEKRHHIVKMDTSGDRLSPIFKNDPPETYELIGLRESYYYDKDDDRQPSDIQEHQDFAQDDELSNGGYDIL
jgi:hypothetical protein|tara:strand:+ start:2469 stop:3221 length:753 start_codon:yes stop_codon:yes gene_type:complete